MVTMVGYVLLGRFYGMIYSNHGQVWLLAVGFLKCEMVFTVGYEGGRSIFLVFLIKKRFVALFLFILITCDQQTTNQLTNQIN